MLFLSLIMRLIRKNRGYQLFVVATQQRFYNFKGSTEQSAWVKLTGK